VTLCAVGTSAKRFASDLDGKKKSEKAAFIGAEIARLAKETGVSDVVFDRGPYMYHGRVKALADSARESGLQF
jgi:large subunit ribosomal protein L18